MSRSLRVDPKYIQKVNLALKRNGYPSQRKFAEDIVPSLSTVKNFLKGKPVDYENFREICERLGLDWQAITYIDVDVEPDEEVTTRYQESVESDAGSIEDRIFKATNQLNPERPVFSRISGIQALGEIAKDSPRYHWQIMEILAAFVRTNAPRKEEGEEERSQKPREDIQAALRVIGGRDPNNNKGLLDLSNTDIRGAELHGAKLQGVNLNEANLQGTELYVAQLQGAFLNRTQLQRARLNYANLQGAYLSRANLQSADLTEVNLREAKLTGANLQGAILQKADCHEADFYEAELQRAYLYRVTNLNLQQIQFAYGDSDTVLPDDVERPAHWM
jgi:uncharacterized protein YjbI with pentapeptide repeats